MSCCAPLVLCAPCSSQKRVQSTIVRDWYTPPRRSLQKSSTGNSLADGLYGCFHNDTDGERSSVTRVILATYYDVNPERVATACVILPLGCIQPNAAIRPWQGTRRIVYPCPSTASGSGRKVFAKGDPRTLGPVAIGSWYGRT